MSNTIDNATAPAVAPLSSGPALFHVAYVPAAQRDAALADPQTLAVFGFGLHPAPLATVTKGD